MNYLYKTLNGTFTKKTKLCGYCTKHCVNLTNRQVRIKGCLTKKCDWFRKIITV